MCKCVQLHRPPRVAATRKVYCTATRCRVLRAAWLRVVCLDDDTVIRAQRCICNYSQYFFTLRSRFEGELQSGGRPDCEHQHVNRCNIPKPYLTCQRYHGLIECASITLILHLRVVRAGVGPPPL